MRWKRSFLLHLYFDADKPTCLLGDLQATSERKAHSFKSGADLIALLTRLVSADPIPPQSAASDQPAKSDDAE